MKTRMQSFNGMEMGVRTGGINGRCLATVAVALMLSVLSACAMLQPEKTGMEMIGSPQEQVRETFGTPTGTYRLADGHTRWIYSKQPMGPQVFAAEFGADGKLMSFKQMLQFSEFSRVRVDEWTKKEVEEHFGLPGERIVYFSNLQREAWSYRYVQNGVEHLMFNFYFDNAGVLRRTEVAPDPLFIMNGDGGRR